MHSSRYRGHKRYGNRILKGWMLLQQQEDGSILARAQARATAQGQPEREPSHDGGAAYERAWPYRVDIEILIIRMLLII